MYQCQQALIHHLNQFTDATVNTIKGYAGELKEAHKLTQILPAVLVIWMDRKGSQDKSYQFDLLVVTETTTLDKLTHKNSNIQLASQIAEYMESNPILKPQGGITGTYFADPEKTTARTILVDPRFTIVQISLFVDDRTG